MDKPKITGDSPQAVAYALLADIDHAEQPTGDEKPMREWILDTYKDCLRVVHVKALD